VNRRPGTDESQWQQSHERATVLRRLNRWQAEQQREDLADLYVECCDIESGEEFHQREMFKDHLVADARRPGFDMLVAETDTLVGFVLGIPVDREGVFWHGFIGALPPYIEQLSTSGHVFAVTDLVVHPYTQDHATAGRLLDRILGDNHASLGVCLVNQGDQAFYTALRAWGWQEIGEVRRAPTEAVLRALVLPIGERTQAVPGGLVHDIHTQRPEVT
jgi:hypothetical protein